MGFDMKEYLRKNSGGKYITEFASEQEASELHAADWIEIPEGADTLAGDKHIRYFWKHGNPNFIIGCGESLSRYPNWDKCDDSADEWVSNFKDDTAVIWQRESPNDKLASAEQYRQAEVLPFIDSGFAESDAWIESNIEQDNVNNPSHYADGEIECIDAIQSSMTHEAFCGYLKGNIQKYIWRYEKKGGIESLKKGQWYLDKLISVL